MLESDMSLFSFSKLDLDISGPYPQIQPENQFIVSFIDLYSRWPEVFAVLKKMRKQYTRLS